MTGGASWRSVFDDEFGGTSVNPANWNVQNLSNYGSGNNEDECYLAANTTVADGALNLVGKRETVSGCGANPDGGSSYFFTSGMVTTRAQGGGLTFKFRQGYAEVRMRVPRGNLYWPAFWLVGAGDGSSPSWPDYGEIDVTEIYGSKPDISESNFHKADGNIGAQNHNVANLASDSTGINVNPPNAFVAGATNSWHTYGINWTANRLDWYIDGVKVRTYTAKTAADVAALGYEHSIILNLAMGGNGPAVLGPRLHRWRVRRRLRRRQPDRRPARCDAGRLRQGLAALSHRHRPAPVARGARRDPGGRGACRVALVAAGREPGARWLRRSARSGGGSVASRARTLRAALLLGLAGAVLLTLVLAGSGPARAAVGPPKSVTVKILPTAIQPPVVNVVPGETVVWVNQAGATRSILASDASFDSGALANGERFQFAFTQPRTVSYSVVQTPGFSGTVVVAVPGSAAPAPVASAGPAASPFAPAAPVANPADPQPSGFAYTGSATATNGLVGGLVLACGAGLVMTARRFGVAATFSRLSFSLGPDDLLPSRRHRRERKDEARRGRIRR